jgi:hypothetical protein
VSRLVILIAAAFIAWLALRWFIRTPPQQVIKTLKQGALWGVALVVIALALTGRLHWMAAAGAAILPFARRAFGLMRFLPLAQGLYGRAKATRAQQAPASGQTSTVETRFLCMTLDHDTGDMDGEVLEGGFEDRLLSQLSLDELLALLNECQQNDSESAALLQAYLDRTQPEWRDQFETQGQTENATPASDTITTDEAHEILGVTKDATKEEITQAHRRLMLKLHPDRGGSDYLATKINLAKDCLLDK